METRAFNSKKSLYKRTTVKNTHKFLIKWFPSILGWNVTFFLEVMRQEVAAILNLIFFYAGDSQTISVYWTRYSRIYTNSLNGLRA